MRFVAKNTSQTDLGKSGGVEFDRDINSAHRVIGYDVLTFVSANGVDVALALDHGFLYGHFTIGSNGAINGKVTGGAGAYHGAHGTISGQSKATGSPVTVTYRN